MGQVTHEQASLLLRLYELRRESRMRQARLNTRMRITRRLNFPHRAR